MKTKTNTTIAATLDTLQRLAASPIGRTLPTTNDRLALLVLEQARANGEELVMSVLGERLGLSRAAITSLVDRLELGRHAYRAPSDTDRRVTNVSITHEASKAVQTAFEPVSVAA